MYERSTVRQYMEQLTLLPADSLVNHSVRPGSEKAQTMTATSGLRCIESLPSSARDGYLVKTFLDSLLSKTEWRSNVFALTWKHQVTKYGRSVFLLVPRVHRTEGIGGGSLPTPRVNGTEGYKTRAKRKGHDWAMSYLETAIDHLNHLPTPTQRDYKGARTPEAMAQTGRNPMTNDLESALIGTDHGWKLQPRFVEWMMGYPDNWTEIESTDSKP